MRFRSVLHPALVLSLLAVPTGTRAADPPAKPVDFTRDVKPIFDKHCISCHGPDKPKSRLRLDRAADALAGGDSGKVLVPGKAAESKLVLLVAHDDTDVGMPPKKPALTAVEVATLRAWIDQGANWPDDGSVTAKPTDWWSLKSLKKPTVPAGTNPIDHFIRSKFKEKGLTPRATGRSPHAHPQAVLRPHRSPAVAGRSGCVRQRQGRKRLRKTCR